MALRIAVLSERAAGENRVALSPETAKKFAALGAVVAVEEGAGLRAAVTDEAYREAGAEVGSAAAVIKDADIVLGVQAPDVALLAGAKPGAWVAATFDPFRDRERVEAYAKAGLEALSMEFMPRITRAQSMDVLSSQSNLAGYKAVLTAANTYGRAFPMMMTAAGTVQAARVFVMGVGVAGRAGFGHRRAQRNQGTDPVAWREADLCGECRRDRGRRRGWLCHRDVRGIPEGAGRTGIGAYRQAGHRHHHRADPRQTGPAAAQGGNVEGSMPDEVVEKHGVKIVGYSNTAGHLAADASALFARNHYNFLSAFWDKEAGKPVLDEEIGDAVRLTQGGKIVHERLTAQ